MKKRKNKINKLEAIKEIWQYRDIDNKVLKTIEYIFKLEKDYYKKYELLKTIIIIKYGCQCGDPGEGCWCDPDWYLKNYIDMCERKN